VLGGDVGNLEGNQIYRVIEDWTAMDDWTETALPNSTS
jgi:hypothetical protein